MPKYSEIFKNVQLIDEVTDSDLFWIEKKFTRKFDSVNEKFLKFRTFVENVLDMESLPDSLRINSSYSAELEDLKGKLNEAMEEINEIYEEAREGWCNFGKDRCLLEPDKARGFVLRLSKANLQKELKGRNRAVETISVLKNGVHFTTPKLKEVGEKYCAIKIEYKTQQEELVQKAVEIASTYLPLIEAASKVISKLDVFVSLAEAAALAPHNYVKPTLLEMGSGVMNIKGARHPCLEWQDNVSFMPNDYTMDKDGSRFLIMTGPNMGGKSTYIRTIGFIAIMAQIGSFVPATSAELSVIDALFARVGANDAQLKGVSTFMAEMLEASSILNAASENSLIIIDELGRGTSTYDGFGIAWAISHYIIRVIKAMALFATHFHEITKLSLTEKCARNVHANARTTGDGIEMLYEMKDGPCLESFGVHVASIAGFPSCVTNAARKKSIELEALGGGGKEGKVCLKKGLVSEHCSRENLVSMMEEFKRLPLAEIEASERRLLVQNLIRKYKN